MLSLTLWSMFLSRNSSKNSEVQVIKSGTEREFICWVTMMLIEFFSVYSNEVLCSRMHWYRCRSTLRFLVMIAKLRKACIMMRKF